MSKAQGGMDDISQLLYKKIKGTFFGIKLAISLLVMQVIAAMNAPIFWNTVLFIVCITVLLLIRMLFLILPALSIKLKLIAILFGTYDISCKMLEE